MVGVVAKWVRVLSVQEWGPDFESPHHASAVSFYVQSYMLKLRNMTKDNTGKFLERVRFF